MQLPAQACETLPSNHTCLYKCDKALVEVSCKRKPCPLYKIGLLFSRVVSETMDYETHIEVQPLPQCLPFPVSALVGGKA